MLCNGKAKNTYLKDGISVAIVVKNTGLTNEEVEKIAARLGKKIA